MEAVLVAMQVQVCDGMVPYHLWLMSFMFFIKSMVISGSYREWKYCETRAKKNEEVLACYWRGYRNLKRILILFRLKKIFVLRNTTAGPRLPARGTRREDSLHRKSTNIMYRFEFTSADQCSYHTMVLNGSTKNEWKDVLWTRQRVCELANRRDSDVGV